MRSPRAPRAPSHSAAPIIQSRARPSAHRLNQQRSHCFTALTARQFQRIATVTLQLACGATPPKLTHKQELRGKCQDAASFLRGLTSSLSVSGPPAH